MKIIVNGAEKILEPEPSNLAQLIEDLGYHPRLIVVEFNGVIVTPSLWRKQAVGDGDILEIVTIVGGGS